MCQVAHVTDRDLGLKAFIRQLEVARKVEVVVGIQANAMHKGESVAFMAPVTNTEQRIFQNAALCVLHLMKYRLD